GVGVRSARSGADHLRDPRCDFAPRTAGVVRRPPAARVSRGAGILESVVLEDSRIRAAGAEPEGSLAAGVAFGGPPVLADSSPAVSESTLGYLLGALALATITAGAAGLGGVPAFETFALIFSSIVIEALPFILLGALVSAAL